MSIVQQKLANFLVQAKRATYAAGGGQPAAPVLPGSRQLEYRDGDLFYRDIYYGFNFFAGQEVVYWEDRPVWTMCYGGAVTLPGLQPAEVAEIYDFLQTALAQVPPGIPARGPDFLALGAFTYRNQCSGSLEHFWGMEEITRHAVAAYRLHYQGGMLD